MFLRFTLSHATVGTLVINVPDGWKEAEINFERHPDLHCVRPKFNTPLDFYGKNVIAGIDGGRDFVLEVEEEDGPDAVIGVLVERSRDGFTWIILADQEFPISGPFADKVGIDHRVESTLTDKSFWAKFISRFETPVDVNGDTNEDGTEATVHSPVDLTLTSQKIQQQYSAKSLIGWLFYGADDGDYIEFDHDAIILDEVNTRFPLSNSVSSSPTVAFGRIYILEFDGSYELGFKRQMSVLDVELPDVGYFGADTWIDWYFQLNDETPILFNELNSGTPNVDEITTYTYFPLAMDLKAGDVIKVYAFIHTNINDLWPVILWGEGGAEGTNPLGDPIDFSYPQAVPVDARGCTSTVLANTTYPDTQIQADLIHDLGMKISDRITGVNDSFRSNVLGSPYTMTHQYDESGIYWEYAHALGLHARGYTLTQKPFFQSMRDYWQGINPLFNLGMGVKKFPRVPPQTAAISLPALSSGVNIAGPDVNWTTGATPTVALSGSGSILSDIWANIYPFIDGYTYELTPDIDYDFDTANLRLITFVLLDASDNIVYDQEFNFAFEPDSGTFVGPISFLAPAGAVKYGFKTEIGIILGSASATFTINSITGEGTSPEIPASEKIYIGKKEEFYPTDRVSVRLSGVYKITRKYDPDYQFNLIEQGYEKGKIEDVSGLDDWLQVNRSTRFKKIGKRLPNLSKMIGASLTWEQARRTTILKSADYKYDNDTFIVNVKRVEDAPYVPALDEEFDAVTNLINEETRYNKKLTPGRNFLRWINFYSGCLQAYLSSFFRFAGGDGNVDMTSEMIDNGDVESFGGAVLSEKQDIPVSTNYLFLPMPYTIEHYVTFSQLEAMLADPEAAIEVSQTQSGHKLFFIKNISVQVSIGKITGELWPKEYMKLQVVSKPGRIFSDEFGEEFG